LRLKGQRDAPSRNEIELGDIRDSLPYVLILETNRLKGYPFQVVGTRVEALFKHDLRAASFAGLWQSEQRGDVEDLLQVVADEKQPFLVGAGGAPVGGEEVELEVLLLPLQHSGRWGPRLFGSCVYRGRPNWLGILSLKEISMLWRTAVPLEALATPFGPNRPAAAGRAPPTHKFPFLAFSRDR
jgi:hypothetical protein